MTTRVQSTHTALRVRKWPTESVPHGHAGWLLGALILIGAQGLGGCAAPLPRYPHGDPAGALAIMTDRAAAVRTISATCRLALARPDGSTLQLDAALVARPPDHARVRAWKLSRAVLDITLTSDGLYLITPADDREADDPLACLTAARWRQAMMFLLQQVSEFDWIPNDASTSDALTLRAAVEEGGRIDCSVDRDTLTITRCELFDPDAGRIMTVAMDRYRMVGPAPVPRRVALRSTRGDITIYIDSVEINVDLPATAFTPPRRATHRP